jgi:hypothetical protein
MTLVWKARAIVCACFGVLPFGNHVPALDMVCCQHSLAWPQGCVLPSKSDSQNGGSGYGGSPGTKCVWRLSSLCLA